MSKVKGMRQMKQNTIVIIGSLDTKGEDFAFLKDEIAKRGFSPFVIDVGVLGDPQFLPDISAQVVADAGGKSLDKLRETHDRGDSLAVMELGVASVMRDLYETHKTEIVGSISLGGGGGTALGTSAMRQLPIGIPKIMVSTLASGDTAPYVQTSDIVLVPSIVDVSGLNRISRDVYRRAVAMVCGAADANTLREEVDDKVLLAASMFGNTTKLVSMMRTMLEERGYELIVFHAVGSGGRVMEALIRANYFAGVLDVTTTELADEVCGGVLSAGNQRMRAAAETGIPQIIVPGCIDMCNFWALETVPEKYRKRNLHTWNPNVTLMRTSVEENIRIAEIMAENINRGTAPKEIFIPLKGYSELDIPGGPFWDPAANLAFVQTLKNMINNDIHVHEVDCNVNDPQFASILVDALEQYLDKENR